MAIFPDSPLPVVGVARGWPARLMADSSSYRVVELQLQGNQLRHYSDNNYTICNCNPLQSQTTITTTLARPPPLTNCRYLVPKGHCRIIAH